MPIDPSAEVAPTACVHPNAVIGPRAVIGDFAIVEQDVVIGAGTRLEPHVYVKRWTTLGERNEISASTVLGTDPLDKNFTGERSYLRIGNDNKIREPYTISRGVVIHQYSKIGRLAMIGGNTRVNSDLPPYFLYSDFNVASKGLNLLGLRRSGLKAAQITALKTAYRILYRSGLQLEEALQRIEAEVPTEHTLHLIEFIRSSKRGICRE